MTENPSTLAILREALENQSKEQLITVVFQRAERISELIEKVECLYKKCARLSDQIEELQRIGHRQAAPFRRYANKKVANPKKPGRKTGHRGSWHQLPSHIDEEIDVLLEDFLRCREPLSDLSPIEQII